MRRLNKYVLLAVLTLSWLFCFNAMAKADVDSDPVTMLQTIADRMISELRSNEATLKTKPQIVYALANKIVVPHADLPEMSRRVVPPQVWNDATSAQKQQFEKEFTTLLIRTYASALTAYKDQTVQIYPIRGGYADKTTVEVSSDIVSPDSPPIHVTYRLLKYDGQWRLFDMSVEGVSLIESFRSQFADLLAQGNMAQLITRLAQHNTEMMNKSS